MFSLGDERSSLWTETEADMLVEWRHHGVGQGEFPVLGIVSQDSPFYRKRVSGSQVATLGKSVSKSTMNSMIAK